MILLLSYSSELICTLELSHIPVETIFGGSWVSLANDHRFNATRMLEMLRGKRMMFIGDSLNRGQYVSMVCLLHQIIPEHAKSMETVGSLTVFRAKVMYLSQLFATSAASYLYCNIYSTFI